MIACTAAQSFFPAKNGIKLNHTKKESVREVARDGSRYLRKICRSQSTNQQGIHSAHRTDLCFAIFRFSQVVFILRAQPHAQSLFLFPIFWSHKVVSLHGFCMPLNFVRLAKSTEYGNFDGKPKSQGSVNGSV